MSRDGGGAGSLPSVGAVIVVSVTVAIALNVGWSAMSQWTARREAAKAEACSSEVTLRRVMWWERGSRGGRLRCECVLSKERGAYDCVCVSPALQGG